MNTVARNIPARLCGGPFPWEWFILDVAFALALLGGSLVLRAKRSLPAAWVTFGVLSVAVGGFLLAATYQAQADYGAAVAAAGSSVQALTAC